MQTLKPYKFVNGINPLLLRMCGQNFLLIQPRNENVDRGGGGGNVRLLRFAAEFAWGENSKKLNKKLAKRARSIVHRPNIIRNYASGKTK
ncbi:hypothetical protein Y032_0303g1901 [Ancylostoma ceylanicum]|uniref:Uncharacterized protein n=1 Tax=Ancylostoma ceylanicum TaxID=53326 RepID=A0A016S3G6_9BILA|nr:hypothetical protein Y032_0303g1901 [Ancylostoma ceylanicum]